MQVIVKGSLGFKQPRSAVLDSGGHEGALGAGKLKRALWVRANTRDALGADKLEAMFLDTGWRFPMSVIWQYAAFCLTALQQINTSDHNKAHFSNSVLPFSIGVWEVRPKMISAYKQKL